MNKTMNKSTKSESESIIDDEFVYKGCFIETCAVHEKHHIVVYTPKSWKQNDCDYFQKQLTNLDTFGRQRIVINFAQETDWKKRHKYIVGEFINCKMRRQLATASATLHQPEIDEENE